MDSDKTVMSRLQTESVIAHAVIDICGGFLSPVRLPTLLTQSAGAYQTLFPNNPRWTPFSILALAVMPTFVHVCCSVLFCHHGFSVTPSVPSPTSRTASPLPGATADHYTSNAGTPGQLTLDAPDACCHDRHPNSIRYRAMSPGPGLAVGSAVAPRVTPIPTHIHQVLGLLPRVRWVQVRAHRPLGVV